MNRHPILHVNEELTGRGTLELWHGDLRLEIDLACRYVRLLVVLYIAHVEDTRNRRIPKHRGFRSRPEIVRMLSRLPGRFPPTLPEEVGGKVFAIRRIVRLAIEEAGLPPIDRHALIESLPGWGYRLNALGLEIDGWSAEGQGQREAHA